MRSRVVVLIAALVATVLGLLGAATATAVAASSDVHAYAYDGHRPIADLTYTNTERGPPANGHTSTMTPDTVDGLSRRVVARPNNRTLGTTRTYDAHPQLVQAARATATTAEPAQMTDVDLSSSLPWHVAAKTTGTAAEAAVHGNSAASPATAYLYRLSDAEGNYLKTGISKNPGTRYPKSFMRDKDMEILQSGNRREMLNLERFIVERDPGPLNREPWRGAFGWDVP